jgi:hypothetical protein
MDLASPSGGSPFGRKPDGLPLATLPLPPRGQILEGGFLPTSSSPAYSAKHHRSLGPERRLGSVDSSS